MITRRLLTAGRGGGSGTGGSGFVQPDLTPFTVLAPPNAGWWTEVTGPHAMYANGKTYIGWIAGNTRPNDVEIAAISNTTRAVEGPTLVRDNLTPSGSTSPDSHNNPAVLVRSDGRILMVYCGHSEPEMHARISTNPYDISSFGTEFTIDPITGGFTYPYLAQLTSTGRIFLFIRRELGGVADFVLTTSDDGGATWAAGFSFFHSQSNPVALYGAYASDGVNRIDLAFINRSYDDPAKFGLYHGYMNAAGTVFKTNGTTIGGSFPYYHADFTEVAADGTGDYPYSLVLTNDGRPVIGYQSKYKDPVELGEYRWSGSAWAKHVILTTAPAAPGATSVGGGVHDTSDSLRFLTGRMVSGEPTIWLYTSTDDGVTWSGSQIAELVNPTLSPANVQAAAGGLSFLWFTGTFTSGSNFDIGLDALA